MGLVRYLRGNDPRIETNKMTVAHGLGGGKIALRGCWARSLVGPDEQIRASAWSASSTIGACARGKLRVWPHKTRAPPPGLPRSMLHSTGLVCRRRSGAGAHDSALPCPADAIRALAGLTKGEPKCEGPCS